MSNKSSIEFKINKVKRFKINNTSLSDVQFDQLTTSNNTSPEFITSLNDGLIQSSKPTISKNELSIPVQPNTHLNIFKHTKILHKPITSLDLDVNNINNNLEQIIIEENKANNEIWNNRSINERTPMNITQNNFNSILVNDITSVQEDVESADYDQVSVSDFGTAALRGMGYNENTDINMFKPKIRPRSLGLGADRQVLENLNKLKRNLKESNIDENDDLYLEKGAFIIIEKGSYHNFYGIIESIDEDLNRIIIRVIINDTKNEIISIPQLYVRLVTEKEFLKYSKYVEKFQNETKNN